MPNYKAKKIYACSIYVQLISNCQWYCRCQRNDSWILKIICQCDVKYIMMLLIKIITSVLKISTYIMTGITAHSIRLPAILAIMPVSTCRYFILKKFVNALVRLLTFWLGLVKGYKDPWHFGCIKFSVIFLDCMSDIIKSTNQGVAAVWHKK